METKQNPFKNRSERELVSIDGVSIVKEITRDLLLGQAEIDYASTKLNLSIAEKVTRKTMSGLSDKVRIGIIGIMANYGLTGLEAGSKLRNLFLDLMGEYSTICGIIGFHVIDNQTLINSLVSLKEFSLSDCALMVGKEDANVLVILIKEVDKIKELALK